MDATPDSGLFDVSDTDVIQSLERGIRVLRSFSEDTPDATLTEVAMRTGLTKATARRILHTLARLGYVGVERRRFHLLPRVLELGYAYLSAEPLWRIAETHMEALTQELGESCSLAVLDGTEIVYILRVPTKRILTIGLGVGARLPAYPASLGRVLLAASTPQELDDYFARIELVALTHTTVTDERILRGILAQVADQGFSLVDQEFELGLRSIAAPLHDRRGRVIGAINVATHSARVDLDELHARFIPRLIETASTIDAALAAVG